MKKQWQILEPDTQLTELLQKTIGCHPATAAVLVNRKIRSEQMARNFLESTVSQIRPPFAIKDLDAAADRIAKAVVGNQKILVFGDYDADGITATILLWEFFRDIGANAFYYIPHRLEEGYGLQVRHIENVAVPERVELLITVDCGSSSHAAVEASNNAGIDVVVTDHHIPPDTLPRAAAVVNPKRADCDAAFEHLAGVGVAFYLLIGLRKKLRDLGFWKNRPEPNLKQYLDLVCLGTLADMVPLVGENRILSKAGIDIIRTSGRPGIKSLLLTRGIDLQWADSEDLIFSLIPMLNAAGRMAHASLAVELLTTDNPAKARKIAGALGDLNEQRRSVEKDIFDAVLSVLTENPELLENRSLVFSHNDWHEGVLGIVAARIVQKFHRPAVLFNITDGIGKGSARSVPGFNLVKGLRECAGDLESFGGHAMAAGLKIKTEKIDEFRKNLETVIDRMSRPEDFVPSISIDCELDFKDISNRLIDEIDSLKPFGVQNREPLFMSTGLKVISSEIVGNGHRRMMLRQASTPAGRALGAIHFNAKKSSKPIKTFDRIAFRLRWNRWSGRKTPQIVIEDTRP